MSSFCFTFISYVILNIFLRNFFTTPGKFKTTTFIPTPLNHFSEKTVIVKADAKKYQQYTFGNRNHYRRQKKCHKKSDNESEYAKDKYVLAHSLQKHFYPTAAFFASQCHSVLSIIVLYAKERCRVTSHINRRVNFA